MGKYKLIEPLTFKPDRQTLDPRLRSMRALESIALSLCVIANKLCEDVEEQDETDCKNNNGIDYTNASDF